MSFHSPRPAALIVGSPPLPSPSLAVAGALPVSQVAGLASSSGAGNASVRLVIYPPHGGRNTRLRSALIGFGGRPPSGERKPLHHGLYNSQAIAAGRSAKVSSFRSLPRRGARRQAESASAYRFSIENHRARGDMRPNPFPFLGFRRFSGSLCRTGHFALPDVHFVLLDESFQVRSTPTQSARARGLKPRPSRRAAIWAASTKRAEARTRNAAWRPRLPRVRSMISTESPAGAVAFGPGPDRYLGIAASMARSIRLRAGSSVRGSSSPITIPTVGRGRSITGPGPVLPFAGRRDEAMPRSPKYRAPSAYSIPVISRPPAPFRPTTIRSRAAIPPSAVKV